MSETEHHPTPDIISPEIEKSPETYAWEEVLKRDGQNSKLLYTRASVEFIPYMLKADMVSGISSLDTYLEQKKAEWLSEMKERFEYDGASESKVEEELIPFRTYVDLPLTEEELPAFVKEIIAGIEKENGRSMPEVRAEYDKFIAEFSKLYQAKKERESKAAQLANPDTAQSSPRQETVAVEARNVGAPKDRWSDIKELAKSGELNKKMLDYLSTVRNEVGSWEEILFNGKKLKQINMAAGLTTPEVFYALGEKILNVPERENEYREYQLVYDMTRDEAVAYLGVKRRLNAKRSVEVTDGGTKNKTRIMKNLLIEYMYKKPLVSDVWRKLPQGTLERRETFNQLDAVRPQSVEAADSDLTGWEGTEDAVARWNREQDTSLKQLTLEELMTDVNDASSLFNKDN